MYRVMTVAELSFCILLLISTYAAPITRDIANVTTARCEETREACLSESPFVIRQFPDQSVMSWTQGRALCLNPNDTEVDGMATLDLAVIDTSLDDQFDVLRAACANLTNDDGQRVNCWVGGRLNDAGVGYVFKSADTNRLDYVPAINDSTRWGCVRNTDGSCKKDIEGIFGNDEDYLMLFQNRDHYLADWPHEGGTNDEYLVTAVVCNSNKYSFADQCQCSCDSCDIYGEPHINTFDGLVFHTQGYCAYHAVTPCFLDAGFGADFPLEISTENVECVSGFSVCLKKLYVSLYDLEGVLQTILKFEHERFATHEIRTTVTFLDANDTDSGELQLSGDVVLDALQTWIAIPPSADEPWAFLLHREREHFVLSIWTHSQYPAVRVEFRDLSLLTTDYLYMSAVRISLSSCFQNIACGVCGRYDGSAENELVVRDALSGELRAVTDSVDLADPFDADISDTVEEFTSHWIDIARSVAANLNEMCHTGGGGNLLCEIGYCDDLCACQDRSEYAVSTYQGVKQMQCNHDLAACLGWLSASTECAEFKAMKMGEQEQYLDTRALHCMHLVQNYCCYKPFCENSPDFCGFSSETTTSKEPTQLPTPAPTLSPTLIPTESPTKPPTLTPSTHPTKTPTLSPTNVPTTTPTQIPTQLPTNQPTSLPTKLQTASPTVPPLPEAPDVDTPCSTANVDMVFLADNSCNLDATECGIQQAGIADFMTALQSGSSDARVAYVAYSTSSALNVVFGLTDIDLEFTDLVRAHECGGADATDLVSGVEAAVDILRNGVTPETPNRTRKIIIFSNCQHTWTTGDVCDELTTNPALMAIDNQSIEYIIVNIKSNGARREFPFQSYLQCLVSDSEPGKFIAIPQINEQQFARNIPMFLDAVCEPTLGPTHAPTGQPSKRPTMTPTKSPTLTPTVPPSARPSNDPSSIPTATPTSAPTFSPTLLPSSTPTLLPTSLPTRTPTTKPTRTPTYAPTFAPTHQPTNTRTTTSIPTAVPTNLVNSLKVCDFNGDADILFLTDSTCGLSSEQCTQKRQFVSELVQTIKNAHNPRIALLECGETFGAEYSIEFTDASFNDITADRDTLLTVAQRNELVDKIELELQCLPGNSTPKKDCLTQAVSVFKSHSAENTRTRKIVYVQICESGESQSACQRKQKIYNNNIEIIIVNVGERIDDAYNDCLFFSGPYNLYRFPSFASFDEVDAQDTKQQLIQHICSSDYFDEIAPVPMPTKQPTLSPTNTPTSVPTKCLQLRRRRRYGSSSDSSESGVEIPCEGVDGSHSYWTNHAVDTSELELVRPANDDDDDVKRYKNYLDGGVDTEFVNDVDADWKYESDWDLHRKQRVRFGSSSDHSGSDEKMFDWEFET